ncbi:hypothetical protein [Sporisorium scitamineum]|uniref:Uncharacterized protein n=1 Tax=Sporisorium scitamineum TaxID=49012 RepID=A0A0F7S7U1_9BASI|nr:hypothetical protein [Sporisorium scitamineum]
MADCMQEPNVMDSAKSQPEMLQDDLYDPIHHCPSFNELMQTKLHHVHCKFTCKASVDQPDGQPPAKRVKFKVPHTTKSSDTAIKQQVVILNSKACTSKHAGKQCTVDLTSSLESSANHMQLNNNNLKYEPDIMAMALVNTHGTSLFDG